MISQAFQKLKASLELNDTFDGLVQQHHNAVRSVIENNGHDGIETKLIGSLQRKTRIRPSPGHTFDIDILVVLESFRAWLPPGAPDGITPQRAMQYLHRALNDSDRYGSMAPQADQPTISFTYKDGTKVELVPAYRDQIGHSPGGVAHTPSGRAYWIPKNGQWVLADYDHEAAYITQMNEASGGHLIPLIKMLKAAKRLHFPQLGSFHLEVLAAFLVPVLVQVLRNNNLPISYPFLITDFFRHAGRYLTGPQRIPGSLSEQCSIDLLALPAIMNPIGAIKDHCIAIENLATDTAQMEAWRILFGDPFPTRP